MEKIKIRRFLLEELEGSAVSLSSKVKEMKTDGVKGMPSWLVDLGLTEMFFEYRLLER